MAPARAQERARRSRVEASGVGATTLDQSGRCAHPTIGMRSPASVRSPWARGSSPPGPTRQLAVAGFLAGSMETGASAPSAARLDRGRGGERRRSEGPNVAHARRLDRVDPRRDAAVARVSAAEQVVSRRSELGERSPPGFVVLRRGRGQRRRRRTPMPDLPTTLADRRWVHSRGSGERR